MEYSGDERWLLPLSALVERLRQAPARTGDTRVVAVDGPAGSGKSTLAGRLAALTGAPIVAMDDLYPGWDGLSVAVPLLVRWVLVPLSSGEPARYRRYDWHDHAYAEWVPVGATGTLVVEGCGCGSRTAAEYLSLLLWVDAPAGIRFARGIERDGESFRPHWQRWARQEEQLFRAERTRDRANFLIDGSPFVPHDPEQEVVLLRPDPRATFLACGAS